MQPRQAQMPSLRLKIAVVGTEGGSVTANAKFQVQMEQPDYLMFWFTTNYAESIPLDKDDRRAFVVKCVGVLDECMPGLSAWILSVLFPERADTVDEKQVWRQEQERASHELARHFMSIDLKQFSITAPAMETVARREVMRKQRTNLDEKADELVAEARLHRLMRTKQLSIAVKSRRRTSAT